MFPFSGLGYSISNSLEPLFDVFCQLANRGIIYKLQDLFRVHKCHYHGAHVAQRHDPCPADIGRGPEGFGVDHVMIGGIRLVELGEACCLSRPVELSGIDDGPADGGTNVS